MRSLIPSTVRTNQRTLHTPKDYPSITLVNKQIRHFYISVYCQFHSVLDARTQIFLMCKYIQIQN